jgi:hypothetical protein
MHTVLTVVVIPPNVGAATLNVTVADVPLTL